MMKIRRASERGHAEHGWLDSYHTFSFAAYYDPEWMGFRSLLPVNGDIVMPRRGVGTHPHRHGQRHAWLHVAEGEIRVNAGVLRSGDAAAISGPGNLSTSADKNSQVLLFDLN